MLLKNILIIFLINFSIANKAICDNDRFIILERGKVIDEKGDCSQRWSPCSTFKIVISLMGYDSGILQDALNPEWEYESGYVDWLDSWRQPHNPKLWLSNSCVWFSQIITKKLGYDKFKQYIEVLGYGNQNISGDKEKNNGITNCWLSSSLLISPLEQVEMLERLVRNTLPVSKEAQEKTKEIMFIEELPNGWKLFGKTGNGTQRDPNTGEYLDQQFGWFVGFAIKEDRYIVFSYLIVDDEYKKSYASHRAQKKLKDKLNAILV